MRRFSRGPRDLAECRAGALHPTISNVEFRSVLETALTYRFLETKISPKRKLEEKLFNFERSEVQPMIIFWNARLDNDSRTRGDTFWTVQVTHVEAGPPIYFTSDPDQTDSDDVARCVSARKDLPRAGRMGEDARFRSDEPEEEEVRRHPPRLSSARRPPARHARGRSGGGTRHAHRIDSQPGR